MNRLDLSALPQLGNRDSHMTRSELVSERAPITANKSSTTNVTGISQLLVNTQNKAIDTSTNEKKLRLRK